MTDIKTASGFTATVDELAADDMEFLDLVCSADDGNPRAYRGIIDKLLAPEDVKRLYEHVRVDGRVPVSAIMREVTEIIQGLGGGKN